MHSERVEFEGASGQMLAGRLDSPKGRLRGQALFAHCFTCGKDSLAAYRVSRALARQGIAVFRFDFTGLGDSSGDFANTNFSSNIADLVAAAIHLRGMGRPPDLLVGHSLGGSAVLAAAHQLPEVRAVATIAAPSDPAHVAGLLPKNLLQVGPDQPVEVELGGRTFRIQRQFLDDAAEHQLLRQISTLGRALLVLHSPSDEVVEIAHATRIFVAAAHPKSFVSLDGADHLLAKKGEAIYAAEVIAAWSSRYFARNPASPQDTPRVP